MPIVIAGLHSKTQFIMMHIKLPAISPDVFLYLSPARCSNCNISEAAQTEALFRISLGSEEPSVWASGSQTFSKLFYCSTPKYPLGYAYSHLRTTGVCSQEVLQRFSEVVRHMPVNHTMFFDEYSC